MTFYQNLLSVSLKQYSHCTREIIRTGPKAL